MWLELYIGGAIAYFMFTFALYLATRDNRRYYGDAAVRESALVVLGAPVWFVVVGCWLLWVFWIYAEAWIDDMRG